MAFALLNSYGQNLVPNPGFEKFRQKPCGIIGTDDPIGLQDFLFDWRTPTSGSSDLWYADTTRECYANSFIGVYPVPRTGKFCIGLYTSLATSENYKDLSQVEEYREYAQTRLAKPLKKGKLYYAEYYVFRIFSSSIATNNFGAVFSNSAIGSIIPKKYPALNYNPQIKSSEVVTDTARWTKISGCFIAEDNYEYLTIGNFSNDAATSLVPMYYKGLPPYYLIDDVLVEEVDIGFVPEPEFLGKDIALCQGESHSFDMASLKPYSFLWQDGSTNSTYIANQSGNYWLELTYKECAFRDTAAINVQMPVQLGPDIKACASTSITLLPTGAKDIRWQDGYEKQDRIVNQSGEYIAVSPSLQCPSSDTIRVEFFPCPGLVPNVFTPNGDNKNDYFVIDNVTITPWIFEVYNRWGKRVYHHPSYDNSWNGGKLASGQYYYRLSSDHLNQSIKGWVNLLR
ncbi:gliding motility-associated C-terminal domain-containing protein [Dyadobacter sp. CY351]|uniref:gliding motility-associated C-terminal domain-containing protein n=1 Tax=Dyadobacter sp. CY351 TaxID=2909337 RepID=UPI001F451D31|nr:gliding motility-associated C-terminal domain-containing protein [Dyadobacter sp. CY351]MCF2520885.1 gliding motility-associated C-terminal domain-containing protein [Dyadobacter sp. CY351]